MSDEPTPFPEQDVAMLVVPVPQIWRLVEADYAGQKVAMLTVMSPFSTTVIPLDEGAALALADSLRAKFSGLKIATQLPGNGASPGGH